MRNLEVAARVAIFGFHLDVSVTPFIWAFRAKRTVNDHYIEVYVAVGPVNIDWSRKKRR